MGSFTAWLKKLNQQDRRELLHDLLDEMVLDEKFAAVLWIEKELRAQNYDWRVFANGDEIRSD